MKHRPCVSVRPATYATIRAIADQRGVALSVVLDEVIGEPASWRADGIPPPWKGRRPAARGKRERKAS